MLAADAKRHTSPLDFFVGITPFADLIRFRQQKVAVPWDEVMPKEVSADIPEVTLTSSTAPGVTHRWTNIEAFADEMFGTARDAVPAPREEKEDVRGRRAQTGC